jgi:P-type Ca2+ transporter type 2C
MKYLLTTNSGELWVMLVGPLLGMPLPLLPLQILWINLVMDGLPALALGVEPPEPEIMRRPPSNPRENIFGHGLGAHVIWVGVLMGLLPLLVGYTFWRWQDPHWQTMVFIILTFCQLSHVMAIRSSHFSLFKIGLLSNKPLLGAVLLTCLLQLVVIYFPFAQSYFHTHSLSISELLTCIGMSVIIFWVVEMEKCSSPGGSAGTLVLGFDFPLSQRSWPETV